MTSVKKKIYINQCVWLGSEGKKGVDLSEGGGVWCRAVWIHRGRKAGIEEEEEEEEEEGRVYVKFGCWWV